MSVWIRELTCGRLIRVEWTQTHITKNPTFTFAPNMAKEGAPLSPVPRSLNQIIRQGPLILLVYKFRILVKM